MKLSIVVPAFNEERLLGRTLTAIKDAAGAWRERGWEYEMIVCDNNSSDRTAEIAREQEVKVVFEPVNQIARARNAGASVARGEWLLFIDADSTPSRELFAEAAGLIAGGEVMFVGAVLRLDEDVPGFARALVAGWNFLSRTLRWMAGSFVLVETGAFREVGGFNQGLYAGEELDLSRRLKALARRRRRRVAIVSRHPLTSSARKMKLYSRAEILGFVVRAILRRRATTSRREACTLWYDGRR